MRAMAGGGGASVNIRQHTSPYSMVGYSQVAASGDTVMERITITVPNAGETIRLQFSVNGLFDNQETYTISGVSLRRIE